MMSLDSIFLNFDSKARMDHSYSLLLSVCHSPFRSTYSWVVFKIMNQYSLFTKMLVQEQKPSTNNIKMVIKKASCHVDFRET